MDNMKGTRITLIPSLLISSNNTQAHLLSTNHKASTRPSTSFKHACVRTKRMVNLQKVQCKRSQQWLVLTGPTIALVSASLDRHLKQTSCEALDQQVAWTSNTIWVSYNQPVSTRRFCSNLSNSWQTKVASTPKSSHLWNLTRSVKVETQVVSPTPKSQDTRCSTRCSSSRL